MSVFWSGKRTKEKQIAAKVWARRKVAPPLKDEKRMTTVEDGSKEALRAPQILKWKRSQIPCFRAEDK
jgi:hypothetical protein